MGVKVVTDPFFSVTGSNHPVAYLSSEETKYCYGDINYGFYTNYTDSQRPGTMMELQMKAQARI